MNALSYPFEELPDFWEGEFRSGAHNGCAQIYYFESGEWLVRAITLDCHNGKCGGAARARHVPLSRAYHGPLWEALCQSLEVFSGDHIQDAVNHALEAEGVSPLHESAEHRLGIRQLV